MKRIVYCLAIVHFLLQPLSGRAQEEFIEPPSKFITSIPFIQLTGGIVIMQAKLDNIADTLNFILDTCNPADGAIGRTGFQFQVISRS